MKATDLQKGICDFIIQQASFWKGTNDIDSPMHYCDIEESLRSEFSDDLTDDEMGELSRVTTNLFNMIKHIKRK